MENRDLQRGLKNRHLQMIALGGAIGTGLFYGSATTIQLAGPATTLAYLIGGTIIFFIMRALGEMTVEEPVSGSFSHFAYKYWGPFPGFVSGWNFWANYIIVSMAELSVVGTYINYWFPDVPTWLSAFICLVVITMINLINVKAFGEFEFWFAIIKVLAIIGMIVFGGYLLFFGTGQGVAPIGFSNLWSHGGFVPNGIHGLILAMVVVMFSFGGVELVGITAGEAENPKKSIPKAVNQIVWRILLFYIGALTIIMALFPWNQIGTSGSPFVEIFSRIGIPAAADILNVVVLTAALSTYNSGLYSNGRMLYGLAVQGNAPKAFLKLSNAGIPVRGVLFSSALTFIIVVLNYLVPGKVFMYMISLATIAGIINWTMILIVQIKFRKCKDREKKNLEFKVPLYPLTSYISLIFLAAIVVIMTYIPDMIYAVYIAPIWIASLYVGYKLKRNI